jgi:hypothetical protein
MHADRKSPPEKVNRRACLDHLVTETFLTLVFLDAHSCRVGNTEKSIA